MVDRQDRLRHKRVAQHASVRREKSRKVLEASGPFGHASPSTSGAHASPHATSFSSSRRRRDSPSDASLPPSSRMRQVSPIQGPEVADSLVKPPIIDAYESVSPLTTGVTNPVPPPESEAAADVEPEEF